MDDHLAENLIDLECLSGSAATYETLADYVCGGDLRFVYADYADDGVYLPIETDNIVLYADVSDCVDVTRDSGSIFVSRHDTEAYYDIDLFDTHDLCQHLNSFYVPDGVDRITIVTDSDSIVNRTYMIGNLNPDALRQAVGSRDRVVSASEVFSRVEEYGLDSGYAIEDIANGTDDPRFNVDGYLDDGEYDDVDEPYEDVDEFYV